MTDRLCYYPLTDEVVISLQDRSSLSFESSFVSSLSSLSRYLFLWSLLSSSPLDEGILHFVLCWWSQNWVFPNNMTSEQEGPYLEPEGMVMIKIFRNFKKDVPADWLWQLLLIEMRNHWLRTSHFWTAGLLRYSKVFISFHGGCWNVGSRNPALNVPLGTLGY